MAFQGTNFKPPRVAAKVRNGLRRRARTAVVDDQKDVVRARDGRRCRFPLCGCGRFGLALHVSHSKHQGAGGNPDGDRSAPDLMILVCAARHREHVVAIDRGTLKWEPLTDKGADGPVRWLIDVRVRELMSQADVQRRQVGAQWVEVAREMTIGRWEVFSDAQLQLLTQLGRMLL